MKKWSCKTAELLKREALHVKFPMTGQEKCGLFIQVTTWAGLTVSRFYDKGTQIYKDTSNC